MTLVKIVATIGPRTDNAVAIRELLDAGMSVARLNGSHSDLAWHAAAIATLRTTAPTVPILFDIPGRKIRTRKLAHEPYFDVGDTIVLTTSDAYDGREKVPVDWIGLHEYVKRGDTIFADDGTIWFTVMKMEGSDIICRAETAGTLRSTKGINVPSIRMPAGPISARDATMIAFAREQKVDFVGVSFVSSAEMVSVVREHLGIRGPRVLSKVENLDAMNNLDEIIEASDAIMIDRGDLSVETNLESITLFQKRILTAAHRHGKPVVVATEMLHSMIENPFPSKAEVSDISNAVLDGASALMLSGETAIGRFPTEAVGLMRRVADTVADASQISADETNPIDAPQAIGEAISMLCRRLPITKIAAITMSGYAARMIASTRPRQPILAVSNDDATARSMNLLFGTEGVHVDIPFSAVTTDHVAHCLKELWVRGKIADDDVVLVTAVSYPKSGNRMNMIQVHAVSDLCESLGWLL